MGALSTIDRRRVYLDTNLFIYLLEGYPDFADVLRALYTRIDQGEQEAVTSELTIAEVLVKPLIDGNRRLAQAYMQAVQSRGAFRVEPVRWSVLTEAARLRAEGGLKLPDAIHMATAMLTGCAMFLTNDERLRDVGSVTVVRLSALI